MHFGAELKPSTVQFAYQNKRMNVKTEQNKREFALVLVSYDVKVQVKITTD